MATNSQSALSAKSSVRIEERVHARQQEFLDSDARFRAIAAGRRGGKTHACALDARDHLLHVAGADYLVWWVAPTYTQAEIGFRKFLNVFPDELLSEDNISRQQRIVELPRGRIEFKSADRPDNLRGEGVDFLVIDEAAQIGQYAWENALRPTLTDSEDSRMVAISTPKGRNWFHRIFAWGQSPDRPQYESWQFPTTDNPFISKADVEEARDTLPDRVFRQEYLAEFIDDTGGVFNRIRERNVEDYDWREYRGHPPYSIGVDFARHEDWTVITTLDRHGKLANFMRLQQTGWPQIQKAVMQAYDDFPGEGQVRVDATRDNKIVADLEAAGLPVEAVKFTPSKKREMIENLAARLENGEIVLPDIQPLINELEIFEYETTRAGNVRYHAPEGFHDDCVDSLALSASAETFKGIGGLIGADYI